MSDAVPLRLLLLAAPGAPGAEALLERAEAVRAAGRHLDVLLAGPGLGWTHEAALARLAASPGVSVGLCSRSARDRGVDPDTLPDWLRWTSLVAFFTALEPSGDLWGLLP